MKDCVSEKQFETFVNDPVELPYFSDSTLVDKTQAKRIGFFLGNTEYKHLSAVRFASSDALSLATTLSSAAGFNLRKNVYQNLAFSDFGKEFSSYLRMISLIKVI